MASNLRPDPLDWKSGLKSAAASAAGDFLGQFWDDDKLLGPFMHAKGLVLKHLHPLSTL